MRQATVILAVYWLLSFGMGPESFADSASFFLLDICAVTKSLMLFHNMALGAHERHLVSILELQFVGILHRHKVHTAARLNTLAF